MEEFGDGRSFWTAGALGVVWVVGGGKAVPSGRTGEGVVWSEAAIASVVGVALDVKSCCCVTGVAEVIAEEFGSEQLAVEAVIRSCGIVVLVLDTSKSFGTVLACIRKEFGAIIESRSKS